MIQFALNIIPLSHLCELCGKQVVETTRELLLQLHYCCLGKLIRVGELLAENAEDWLDYASVTIGFLRAPTQLGQRIQERSARGNHAAETCKIRGIRNLTLAVLSRNRNLEERQRGHFVLEPEDNGRAHSGIPRGSARVSSKAGGSGTGSESNQVGERSERAQPNTESNRQSNAVRVCQVDGKGQLGRCPKSTESRTDGHPAGCPAVPDDTGSARDTAAYLGTIQVPSSQDIPILVDVDVCLVGGSGSLVGCHFADHVDWIDACHASLGGTHDYFGINAAMINKPATAPKRYYRGR